MKFFYITCFVPSTVLSSTVFVGDEDDIVKVSWISHSFSLHNLLNIIQIWQNFLHIFRHFRKRFVSCNFQGKSERLISESLKSIIGIIDVNSSDAADEFGDCKIAVFIVSTAVISSRFILFSILYNLPVSRLVRTDTLNRAYFH